MLRATAGLARARFLTLYDEGAVAGSAYAAGARTAAGSFRYRRSRFSAWVTRQFRSDSQRNSGRWQFFGDLPWDEGARRHRCRGFNSELTTSSCSVAGPTISTISGFSCAARWRKKKQRHKQLAGGTVFQNFDRKPSRASVVPGVFDRGRRGPSFVVQVSLGS